MDRGLDLVHLDEAAVDAGVDLLDDVPEVGEALTTLCKLLWTADLPLFKLL